ncbi:MAG TPA: carboxypeptidase regulatory-like domain-containing protein [Candidatus Acidoferrales bacterium]|jgi:plastocyanin|nr:carboxypeptidase regulatory-like domain-containing protein [Candidatus Acidoferrales bacterium]
MKLRYSAYLLIVAGLAFALVSCGKNQQTEQPAGGGAAQGGQAVDASTAGTVTGTIKLDGAAPVMKTINMSAEAYCVSQHASSPAKDESVVTGPGGTLANSVVYIQDDMSKYSFTAPADPAKIDQKGCQYHPHVVGMMAGQTLQVTNSDNTTHNIHPVPKDNREWNQSQPPSAAPLMEVFARPENAIPVKCNVHPWMKSYIFVFKNPYFSVTGPDGKFSIGNLPPGTYTVVAWQEQYGTVTAQLTIGAKESKSVDLTFSAASSGD